MYTTEEDPQKILDQQGKTLPLKTAFSIDTRVSEGLEYVHRYEYTHPDVMPSRLLLGFSKGNEKEVHLVGAVVLRVPTGESKHKESKQDLRKAHDGPIEFASREARTGARTRRGAVELLGYNLLQWFSCRLPREDNLKNLEYVCEQKSPLIENVRLLMSKCFPHWNIYYYVASEFVQYETTMPIVNLPRYRWLKRIVEKATWRASKSAATLYAVKDFVLLLLLAKEAGAANIILAEDTRVKSSP